MSERRYHTMAAQRGTLWWISKKCVSVCGDRTHSMLPSIAWRNHLAVIAKAIHLRLTENAWGRTRLSFLRILNEMFNWGHATSSHWVEGISNWRVERRAICSWVHPFAHFAYSFACCALPASHTRSAAFIHSLTLLACSLTDSKAQGKEMYIHEVNASIS